MQTLSDIAPYVALGAAALALVLLVLVIVLMTRVARLRRAQTVVLGRHEQRDIVAQAEDLDQQVRNLREAVEILTDQLDDQKRHLDHALTNRGIVRYDAFRDAGGEQSASFALLDQYRSGVVFSAIAARDFARIYVKHVTEGVADRELSPEEARAVELAVPRPLRPDEEGPKSRRAPLPEARPPAGVGREGTTTPDDGAPTGGADAAEPPVDAASAAAAAFEALGDAVAGSPDPGREGGSDDDFTWEPPPADPGSETPPRR